MPRLRSATLVLALAALGVLAIVAPAGAKTKTFTNPSPVPLPQAIANPVPAPKTLGEASSELRVPKSGTIKDVNVGVQISWHDTSNLGLYVFKGDRYVELSLANAGGPSSADYGGGSGCSGGITVFDGGASSFIYQGQNPFAGSFRPAPMHGMGSDTLAKFNGRSVKGNWRLLVQNSELPPPAATGSINCFQLTVTYKPSKK